MKFVGNTVSYVYHFHGNCTVLSFYKLLLSLTRQTTFHTGFQRIVASGICVGLACMCVYRTVLDLSSRLSCNAEFSLEASFQGHIHQSPKRVYNLNVLGYVSNVYCQVCHCRFCSGQGHDENGLILLPFLVVCSF